MASTFGSRAAALRNQQRTNSRCRMVDEDISLRMAADGVDSRSNHRVEKPWGW